MVNRLIYPAKSLTRYLGVLVCCLLAFHLYGQSGPEGLQAFNLNRIQHQQKAMLGLGGWAVGNIVVGAVLNNQRTGSAQYFHRMNMYWNVVNLGIAGLGYLAVMKETPGQYGIFGSMSKHYGFQQALLFNAGLDVGYVLGGLYLTERARRFMGTDQQKADRLKGFGRSIMLQGGFLFAFDLVNYFIINGRTAGLQPLLTSDGAVGLCYIF